MAINIAFMAGGAGDLIGGRYRLVDPVGQGGMGRVWLGRDEALSRPVAVKEVLLPPQAKEAEYAARAMRTAREAEATARLNHPGIVTIHDVVEHDGVPWIVMEYIPGQSLAAELASSGHLSWQRVAEIGAKMADALAHAHEAGIVHRDLKPENVLLAGDRVVVTDFGIARIIDATSKLTNTGMIIGTPHYMAPEQFEGSMVGSAADLWSLGVTLYVAAEGKPPFDGPTQAALVAAILTQEAAPSSHAGPLTAIVSQLLSKAPDRRPTADATARALRALDCAPAVVGDTADPADVIARSRHGRWIEALRALDPGRGAGGERNKSPVVGLTGLILMLIAGLGEIIGVELYNNDNPGKSLFFNYALYALPVLVALAAIAATLTTKRLRRVMQAVALGACLPSLAGMVYYAALAAPGLFYLSKYTGYIRSTIWGRKHYDSYLYTSICDLLGLAAIIFLMIAIARSVGRGQRTAPRFAISALLWGTVLGQGTWAIASVVSYWPYAGPGFFTYGQFTLPYAGYYGLGKYLLIAYFVGSVAGAAIVALYALRLQDRRLGGILLASWATVTLLAYLHYLWDFPAFSNGEVALNWCAGILIPGILILALAYATVAHPAKPAPAESSAVPPA